MKFAFLLSSFFMYAGLWAQPSIIPMPLSITATAGEYKAALPLRVAMPAVGAPGFLPSETKWMQQLPGKAQVVFSKFAKRVDSLGSEGYELQVSLKGITVKANSDTGLFYGKQTLIQYLEQTPPGAGNQLSLPCIRIIDVPRFAWRGMMLDVCRHFYSKEEVKKLLDMMAYYKLNTFHWHLTDDQGWRIEIKKYPLLTQVGSKRSESLVGHYYKHPHRYDGVPHEGFYTQADIKEIVEYAGKRYITIVPEIEMPGHAQAAIAAYQQLASTPGEVIVRREWGVSNYIYNTKESTFVFLENVIEEVCSLFPGKYFHIGGDEAAKEQWANSMLMQKEKKRLGIYADDSLQSYFIKRIAGILQKNGKNMIGWDEILEGGLAPGAAIMNWRNTGEGKNGAYARQAIAQGSPVVMTPMSHCYFDYYQSKNREEEPLAIGGFLPYDSVYVYEPVPQGLSAAEQQLIIGSQANVWTEYIATMQHLEYMIFPRLLALSEMVWTAPAQKDLSRFKQNLELHKKNLDERKVNYKNY